MLGGDWYSCKASLSGVPSAGAPHAPHSYVDAPRVREQQTPGPSRVVLKLNLNSFVLTLNLEHYTRPPGDSVAR